MDPARLNGPDFIEEMISEKEAQYLQIGMKDEETRALLLKKFGTERLKTLSESRANCYFNETVKFRLTLNGKNMNLIFDVRGGYDRVIDSLPFQQGTFEIDSTNGPGFYPAKAWRKVSDKAEAPDTIPVAFVRGHVVDAVTKKPVPGAEVKAELWGVKVTSDHEGRFELNRLRIDHMQVGYDAVVLANHPDYARGYALIYRRDKEKRTVEFQSLENVTVELAPLVTVSGRVIDEATGMTPTDPQYILVSLKYREDTGIESYIGDLGEVSTTVSPNGTFTLRTAVGKNKVTASSDSRCKQCYYLLSEEINIAKEGRSDWVLKVKRGD